MSLSPNELGFDNGIDFDWLLTRGADVIWHYGLMMQSRLADIEAAYQEEDWSTCMAACASALQLMCECEYRAAGIGKGATPMELQLRMALDDSPLAASLHATRPLGESTREDADLAVSVVRRHDAQLLEKIPIPVPELRSASGSAQSMRLSASLHKWRKERGLPET